MTSSVLATLEANGASLLLTLVPDPERRAPAMARAMGYAISHVGTDPPAALRDRFGALARSLASLGDAAAGEGDALPRIARACRAAIPGARLVVKRRFPSNQRAPQWPVTMRSGAPTEAGRGVWPFDAELAGLRIGRRTLLLREALTLAGAEADAAWLRSQGVATRVVASEDPLGSQRIYGAFDRATLDVAAARHADACRVHDGWADAARWMGEALGYPRCCVERFAAARKRDDVTMFLDLLPPLPHGPASPLSVWLDGALALVSHAPCSLECAATLDLAAAVLAEIERGSPGFEGRWRSLAARVHALDEAGRAFAIDASGDLGATGALRVIDAVELRPPAGADLSEIVAPAIALAGAELRLDRGILVAPSAPGWTAALVADHRGERA